MSRPKPEILVQLTNKTTFKIDQILSSDGIWAVFYKNSPINIKTLNTLSPYPGPKYKKCSFSNKGHAINLAKKLNKQFNCSDFSVIFLNKGDVIYP